MTRINEISSHDVYLPAAAEGDEHNSHDQCAVGATSIFLWISRSDSCEHHCPNTVKGYDPCEGFVKSCDQEDRVQCQNDGDDDQKHAER